mgnify:CR=1 FL=1
MKRNNSEVGQTLFQPTFGNRPEQYIGRDGVIDHFMEGLREPVGSRNRCTLFLGQRGMGKTALLLELSDRAQKAGYVVARVTAHEGMAQAIIEQFQLNGSKFFNDDRRKLTGVSAGVLGFSFGLSFSEAAERQYGFRSKMSLLCDKLAEKDKGALILIDEVRTSAAMREVAAAYQELVGDQKNIGYYIIQYTPQGKAVTNAVMDKAEKAAMSDMDDNVFKPILTPLSDNDKIFLRGMASCGDTVTTAKLQAALGKKGPSIQPYRKRLLEAGVIETPRRGELVFAVPYLADYLLSEKES